jgi:hypothetical protein
MKQKNRRSEQNYSENLKTRPDSAKLLLENVENEEGSADEF